VREIVRRLSLALIGAGVLALPAEAVPLVSLPNSKGGTTSSTIVQVIMLAPDEAIEFNEPEGGEAPADPAAGSSSPDRLRSWESAATPVVVSAMPGTSFQLLPAPSGAVLLCWDGHRETLAGHRFGARVEGQSGSRTVSPGGRSHLIVHSDVDLSPTDCSPVRSVEMPLVLVTE
jgi:hypothetical protein